MLPIPATTTPEVPYYSNKDIIAAFNEEEVRMLYPLIVFYSAILIIGVVGNALVLLVYTHRYKRSPARVYILFLASIDFCMCLFGLPYHVIDLTHPYTFTNAGACKTLSFVIVTLFFMSVFGLIVVAFDRYLKICHPLSKLQMTYFGKKRACGIAITFAFLFSWPNLILYGKSAMNMETEFGNVTGYACYFETQFLETNYPFIYMLTTLCVCVGATVFLIVAYSFICHRIYQRYRYTKSNSCDEAMITEEYSMKSTVYPIKVTPVAPAPSKRPLALSYRRPKFILGKYFLKDQIRDEKTDKLVDEKYEADSTRKASSMSDIPADCNSGSKGSDEVTDDNKVMIDHCVPISIVSASDSSDVDEQDKDEAITDHSDNELADVGTPLKTNDDRLSISACSVIDIKKTDDIASVHPADNMSFHSCYNLSQHLGTISKCLCEVSPATHYDSTTSFTTCFTESPKKQVQQKRIVSQENGLNLGCQDGFPMCKPQTLIKRRSHSCIPNIKTRHERARSLPPTVSNSTTSLQLLDGLRINSSNPRAASSTETCKSNKPAPRPHSKITKIMLTITIVFILSYAPVLFVTFWTIIDPGIWDVIDFHETALLEFALRFYLVNNICNPFIYGFWDKRFKREIVISCRKIYRSMFGRCLDRETRHDIMEYSVGDRV